MFGKCFIMTLHLNLQEKVVTIVVFRYYIFQEFERNFCAEMVENFEIVWLFDANYRHNCSENEKHINV